METTSLDIRYMHFRLVRGEKQTVVTGRDLLSNGGVTVAYVLQTAYNSNDGSRWVSVEYACALCNPKDHYNKKLGRASARGRLIKGRSAFFRDLESIWFDAFTNALCTDVSLQQGDSVYLVNRSLAPNLEKKAGSITYVEPRKTVTQRVLDAINSF